MTTPAPADLDPGCPDSLIRPTIRPSRPTLASSPARATLQARFQSFGSLDAATWDGLVERSPAATPFSRHCVQRAWWDAYGGSAHDQTIVVVDTSAADEIVAIVPLMHRHELEPGDLVARTALRHDCEPATRVDGSATAVFFGASYHADYATVLGAPDVLPAACDAAVGALASAASPRWDVVDLRRIRCGDPAADALAAAFLRRATAERWLLVREQEDVCPVLSLEPGADFAAYLGRLDKKERHEIRRKIRRAEAAGPVSLVPSTDPLRDLDAFVELHQKRWGADGLFPPTAGGAASRRFFEGLFAGCAGDGLVELSFLTVGDRRIAAGVTLDDGETIYYYNAGVDPDARDLSPGVVMVARYVERAIERGRMRLDFMRGDEPYKYAWGAVDEPIERLLVERTRSAADAGRTR